MIRAAARAAVLAAIAAYRRYLSPHKGFTCAYEAHTGRASCSALGQRAVRRFGAARGLAIARRRTHLCGVAHRRYGPPRPFASPRQAGYCDLPCDVPSCDAPLPGFKDLAGCLDCGSCDGPDWRRKKSDGKEKAERLPPKRPPGGANEGT